MLIIRMVLAVVLFARSLLLKLSKALGNLKYAVKVMLFGVMASLAMSSHATGTLADLTAAIDFTGVAAACISGLILLAEVGITIKGAKILLKSLGLMPRG